MDGKLKGLVELRDGNNTANFYGKVTKIEDVADGAGTVQKITVEVTADYLKTCGNVPFPIPAARSM